MHTPTHSQAQPMLSPVRVLVEGQVIWNFKKYFRDTLQSLQPDLAAPFHVNCTEKLMECHKVWTLEDDLVKIRWKEQDLVPSLYLLVNSNATRANSWKNFQCLWNILALFLPHLCIFSLFPTPWKMYLRLCCIKLYFHLLWKKWNQYFFK